MCPPFGARGVNDLERRREELVSQGHWHMRRREILKIGALIRVTVRRVCISWSSHYPYQRLFARIHAKLVRRRSVFAYR